MKEVAKIVTVLYAHTNTSTLPPATPLISTVFHAWKRICGSPLTRSDFQHHGTNHFSLGFSWNTRTGSMTAFFVEAWGNVEEFWFVNGWTGAIGRPVRL